MNNNLWCGIYPDDWNYYFHYPKHRDESLWVHLQSNYTEVLIEEQFIQIVKDILKREQMKTKCIVLGQENEPVKELKKIKFVKFLRGEKIVSSRTEPCKFSNIELVAKEYTIDYDLMFAYNEKDGRHHGIIYLGHWNDGIA